MDLNDQGADIIYTIASSSDLGTIEAAEENGFWAIGADSDMDGLSPGSVLTSMVKYMDVAVYDAIKIAYEGKFESRLKILGLKEGGVGYSELNYTRDIIPTDLLLRLQELENNIYHGGLTIPKTREDALNFIVQ
ncbi:BMP family ABC transporter substrate-binding protein, partial [bacterium]|nr:BMP family ABC transporter substrate-binding protein [bacterium]